jgi:hypothetical protein
VDGGLDGALLGLGGERGGEENGCQQKDEDSPWSIHGGKFSRRRVGRGVPFCWPRLLRIRIAGEPELGGWLRVK